MKRTKALALVLALSVAAAVGSLSWTGGAPAQTTLTNSTGPGFSFVNASAKIIHETVDAVACGLSQDIISCNDGDLIEPINVTQFPGRFSGGLFSDSYEIDAALALDPGVDFAAALNQSIFVALNAGNCDSFQSVFNSTFFNVIPGNDIYVKQIGRWETFSFDGNVPGYPFGPIILDSFSGFSHLSLKGQSLSPPYVPYPHPPYSKMQPTTTFELTGNGNLCGLEGPAAFIVQLGVSGQPVCVDISPTYSTLDITEAFPFACGD